MKKCKWVVFALIIIIFVLIHQVELLKSGYKSFQVDEVVRNAGYPCEIHQLLTSDGYILTMHRIRTATNSPKNHPVLIMHGMFGTSDNFVLANKDQSIVYYLADRGYDVWLGNARGNKYSRRHSYMNPDYDGNFWNFSWHEIGVEDIPKKIDYILEKTNKSQLFYIGHSQGSTSFFVMASQRPEYHNKVKLSVQLAPTVFMKNVRQPLMLLLSQFHYQFYNLALALNVHELWPNMDDLVHLTKKLCTKNSVWTDFCIAQIFTFGGTDSLQLDRSLIPRILTSGISSIAVRQPLHYAQSIMSGKFRQFDYGFQRNLKYYNSKTPPEYYLKNITIPIALVYARNDLLSSDKDVRKLRQMLPNVVMDYLIPYKNFTHFDYLWARDLSSLINGPVYNLLRKYDNN